MARIDVSDNGRGEGVTTDEHSAGMSSGVSPVEMSLLATTHVLDLQARAVVRSSSVMKPESGYSWSVGGENGSKGRHAEGGSGRIRRNSGGGTCDTASRIGGTIHGLRKVEEKRGAVAVEPTPSIREPADAATNPRPVEGGVVAEEGTPGAAVVATDP